MIPIEKTPGLGVFGGTFDPVHLGHLSAVREAGEALGVERVLLVPARRSPHKPEEPATPPHLRLAMLRAAVAGDSFFEVNEAEMDREGPSFTVDTLHELTGANPGRKLILLLGADQWGAFGRWRRPEEIARLATIALMTRGGEYPSRIDPGFGDAVPPPFIEVPVTRLDISSTLVRDRVKSGRSIRFLVPDGVREIIERERLYL